MIEELNGLKETVLHTDSKYFKLYDNIVPDNFPSHWHSDVEIIMPVENIYTVIIDNKEYTLMPKDIIVIPSGTTHELIAPQSGKRIIFQISHYILNEVNGFDSMYRLFFPCAVFRYDQRNNSCRKMNSIIKNIAAEYEEKQPMWEASIHALTISFFVAASRAHVYEQSSILANSPAKNLANMNAFFNICTYINDHCSEELTLSSTAKMNGFSKSQFIRLFKKYSGVSFYEYLTKRRMLKAEILLIEASHSITDVAMLSGFNSLSTFNRVFKNCHHCTPMEYRNKVLPHE